MMALFFFDVYWEGHAYKSYWMINDNIDETCDIGYEFTYPYRIWSLNDGPLQHVSSSDTFEKVIRILGVGNESGLIQVPAATLTRIMIIK